MRQNKTWFFRNNDILKGLNADDLALLDARSEVRRYRRKTTVWQVGDSAEMIYWIRMGVVKVYRSAIGDRNHILEYYSKGDLMGERALFTEKPHGDTALVCEDMTALAMERGAVREISLKNPSIIHMVGSVLSDRLSYQERWHSFLMFRTVPARLAGLFMRMAKTFGIRDSRGIIVNIKMTHKEMASLIGSTRETVSFAILDMKKKGLIVVEAKRIIVVDLEGIQRLLVGG